MATYPRDRAAFLVWAQAHSDIWQVAQSDIGLSLPQVNALKEALTDLSGKVGAQQAAKDAQKAATEDVNASDRAARELVSDLVRSIRAFATNNNNPSVYTMAQIPPPQPGSPVPPPGTPTDFRVGLNSDGSITIAWKAVHPEGSNRVVYSVKRKLPGESTFTLIGVSGEKAYTDDTLPFGVDGATYIVTSQRGSVVGTPSSQLSVTFGSVGGGGGLSFVQNSGPGKMAA